ncbi:fructose-specific PTS transporter subunit EIIC [Gottfriedia acidiceleris]|uniref:fructose-specific PTS transporter subunit EIIC n=1 Tax=Gottfriedia acidiceleris TaxID=371036 RepID=UPI002FFE2666
MIKKADAIVFAVDVAVKDEERFMHLPKVKTSVAAPIRNAKGILKQALQKVGNAPKLEMAEREEQHHDVENKEGSWLWLLRQLGGSLLGQIMIPILSAYMAYSIADKPALGPGFAAGVAANLIGSGFLGGMLGGLLAGYFLKYLKVKVKPKGTFAGFVSFWFYPVVGTLVVGSIMLFVIGKPLAFLNEGLIGWLNGMSGTNAIILGAILGAMVSFDLGGPVNKAAYTFCMMSTRMN